MPLFTGIKIALIAFCAEYVDSSLGMGYGTIMTPLLLLLGFLPLEVVPAVLVSEFLTGILAGFTHHMAGNVDLKPKSTNIVFIFKKIKALGLQRSVEKGFPLDLRIALVLGSCSVVGTVAAGFLALRLPKFWLTFYIGCLIFIIGLVILLTLRKTYAFSWKRLTLLGLIASFNKGISAGGYGPIVTSGQLLTGVKTKNSVGITSLAEGLTCLVGIIIYYLKVPNLNLRLSVYLATGALLSVPFAAFSVKIISEKKMRAIIGIITIVLGILTVTKTLIP
jgi:uncharacterized membrane protein YfcA